ncbi:MAG: NAD(P)-binding protein [Candidatus Geothermarchaeales archaeon]
MRVGILGGGPAGLLTGARLASGDADVTVFEEHREIGVPNHCTSVISRETLAEAGVDPERTVVSRLRGVQLGIPGGAVVRYKSDEVRALVIDRPSFDKELALSFLKGGGEIELGGRVEIEFNQRPHVLRASDGKIEPDVLIDCGGAKSFLRRKPQAGSALSGVQFDVLDTDMERDVAEIWVDKRRNPDFFLWCVPVNSEVVRIGSAWRASPAEEMLMKFTMWRFGSAQVVSKHFGPLIVSGYLLPFFDGNAAFVGDSAGQTKPTTGGGLRYGLMAANLAAEALLEASSLIDVKHALSDYQRNWLGTWKREVDWQRSARRLFRLMGNDELNQVLNWMKEEVILPDLVDGGKLDHHASLLKIASKKALLKSGLSVVRSLILGLSS